MFAIGFGTSAQAQTFSVDSEKAYQLADVCRIKVVFGVVPVGPLLFGIYVRDDVAETQTQLASVSLSRTGVIDIDPIPDNEYSDFTRFTASPSSLTPDTLTTMFTATLFFNLPSDSTQTLRFRAASGDMQAVTDTYSIAESCPKGN